MRIAKRITWDIASGEILDCEYEDYAGPISLCKGSDVANQQRKEDQDMYKTAFNSQQKQLADLKTAMSPYLSGTKGFDPNQLSTMRSQFLNSNNQTFNQAGQQVREALGARGEGRGLNPVGGNYVNGIASLMGARAQGQSQGLLGINSANAQQALQNQFNAANVLSGSAATLTGTQGVAGSNASSALNSYITAANQGFGNAFMTSLGGSLGKSIGSFGGATGPSGTTSHWG